MSAAINHRYHKTESGMRACTEQHLRNNRYTRCARVNLITPSNKWLISIKGAFNVHVNMNRARGRRFDVHTTRAMCPRRRNDASFTRQTHARNGGDYVGLPPGSFYSKRVTQSDEPGCLESVPYLHRPAIVRYRIDAEHCTRRRRQVSDCVSVS